MIVSCSDCGSIYDDTSCWTICPHNPLYYSADALLCRRCDIFVGFHPGGVPSGLDHCVTCLRTAEEIREEEA